MTQNERKKFDEFADSANKEISHPLDDKRWRDFVRQSHADQSSTTGVDVERELRKKEFPSCVAEKYGERYDEDRKLLGGE